MENSEIITIKAEPKKLHYLEGIRALMAFNVILCHFICAYYPMMYIYDESLYGKTSLSIFSTTPLSALVNGSIAVCFFFVLTGFLVGMSVFSKPTKIALIEKKSINRYIRLLPVIALTTLFTFITMKLGLQRHLNITDPQADLEFLSEYCNFNPTLPNLIKNMFYSPFLSKSDYIGPFWTIRYEFWGYIICLLVASILKDSKWRRVWYIGISFVFCRTIGWDYVVFMFGLFVADIKYNSNPTILNTHYEKILKNKVFRFFVLVLGIFLACLPMVYRSIYSVFYYIPVHSRAIRGMGLALLLYLSLDSRVTQKILGCKPLVYLGSLSFETYAIHWPLMLTVEASLFLMFRKTRSYHFSAIMSLIITVVVIYIASILLSMLIKYSKIYIHKLIDKLKNKEKQEK